MGCVCFEDNTRYVYNDVRQGWKKPKQSQFACQQSCQANRKCEFWTFKKPSANGRKGLCFYKRKRANVESNHLFVSGAKNCKLPEGQG